MANIDTLVDTADAESFFTVRIIAQNFPETAVRAVADWTLSMDMGIDMDALQGSDWDVSEPEEQDGTWFVEYSREV